jgi:hypothetical protein
MIKISKKNKFILNELIKKYPKKRAKLSLKLKKIFAQEYKTNRENKINSLFELWMHKNILRSKHSSYINTLEIGAGTLNHLLYENLGENDIYDIVEPKIFLFKNNVLKKKINKIFSNYIKVPNKKYDRIISCATLEHLTDLPKFLSLSAFKLKNKNSFHSHSIPCEGYMAWTIANRYISGFLFKIRTGCNYSELMRHEHVNNYDEIYSMIKFFYNKVNVNFSYPLFFSPHLSFYANISFSNPKLNLCEKYLKMRKTKI